LSLLPQITCPNQSLVRPRLLTCLHHLVFSAPKYCDSTENKGAFINIGPDYELKYTQFDAVPHPNVRPMVSPSGLDGPITNKYTLQANH